ncbi:MAG TPA: ABC transporter substrate-binding protein [Burkholderiales bacterium]|nr:ABC transporter substrate-binding protein [Burkholderiales bacterium]
MKLLQIMLLTVAFAAAAYAEQSPDALVKQTSQEVIDVLKQDKELASGSQDKLLELVEAKVLPHFDFERMTRLTVGKHWNRASGEQKEALQREFKSLLIRTYSAAFTGYQNQTVEVKPLRADPKDSATVQTLVNRPGGKPIEVNYDLTKTPNGWKVYDVTIEGVSLVTNYRSTFATEIQQGGIDGLIKALREKNKSA